MRTLRTVILLPLFLALVPPAVRAAAPPPVSLLSNGTFEKVDAQQWPADWPKPQGVTAEREGETRFLRLTAAKPGQMVLLYRRADLPTPPPAGVLVKLKVRYRDVQPGKPNWHDARVMGHFKSADGRTLKPEPPTPAFHGTSDGWVDHAYVVRVPEGARYLELMPCLFQPESGTLDLAECRVFPATEDQLAAAAPPKVASESITPTGSALPPPLHVTGNRLVNPAGKEVWLQGLCLDSLEWSAGGEKLDRSVPVAIETWKANVIRLPVRDDFWFGHGAYQKKDGGLTYRKLVDSLIEKAASRGAYVALDLHRFGAPTRAHVEFWKDAATRYKNHPAVLFELFNEPHDLSWKLWRDGGPLMDPKKPDAPTGEITPGMQALVDAVRGTGARNVLIAGGLDWSYDLSGVAGEYALKERTGGNGIVYSSHIYPWKKDWKGKVLTAAEKYPLFIGEVGSPPDWKAFSFIPESARTEDLSAHAWQPDVLGMIQKYHLNWTGFSFHPTCAPTVISDWNYTPTAHWGVFVKDALEGKNFELKRMR